ncbi:MAG: hypothetical protein H6709_21745 [Kofleriaceae bacterium]|nr:hypothetical protein [Kofleriaceae bacterium]MCB9574709.1 hypothetical protein [Kofleriaceae bacterium]
MPARRQVLGCLLLAAGCADPGGVAVRVDVPDDPALDPLTRPVAALTLTSERDGAVVHAATVRDPGRGADLDFGDLPVGDDVRFALTGVVASGRVVAYGRAAAPVDVVAGAQVEVPIHLRRPFTYVAGGAELLAADAGGAPGDAYATTIAAAGPVDAAAALPDGAGVVVVAGDALRVVSTATHALDGADAVTLAGPVDDLALSTDGRWAVASHREPPTGVSIVDVAALRAHAATPARFVATGPAGAVAVDDATAWVVEAPLDNLFCGGASRLRGIALADAGAAPTTLDLGGPAGDVAVGDDGAVLVVLPCGDRVVRVAPGAAAPTTLLELPGASAVAAARGRVWATGHVDGADAHLTLASVPATGGTPTVVALPTLEGRARATTLDGQGQTVLIVMTSDLAAASRLAILPDGEHAAIVVAAGYLTEPSGGDGGGPPVIPSLTLVTFEYQLIQLDTGLAAQRLRLSCDITWEPGALLDGFVCDLAPGQDEVASPFVPTDLTVLYGSR